MPRVAVRISPRKPIIPRLGTRNSRRARPKPGFDILTMRPRRSPRRSVDDADELLGHVDDHELHRLAEHAVDRAASRPRGCRAASRSPRAASSRRGSRAAARRGRGRRTCPACRSPRRGWRGSSSSRAARRSRRWRLVRYFVCLLLPAKGEVLTPMRILMVGCSTRMRGRARLSQPGSVSAIVSPTSTSSMPGDGDDLAREGLRAPACASAPRRSRAPSRSPSPCARP